MSAAFNEALVNVVKDYPVVYLKGERRKLVERDRAWIAIAQQLDKREVECKTRWKSIRDNYYKMIKKRNMGKQCDFLNYLDLSFLDDNIDADHSESTSDPSDAIEVVDPDDSQGYTVTVKNEDQYNKYVHNHAVTASEPPDLEQDYEMETEDPLVSVRVEEDNKHGIRVIAQAKNNPPPPLIKIVPSPILKKSLSIDFNERMKKVYGQNLLLKKRLQQLKKLQKAQRTPTHSFFRAMADVACTFPGEKIADLRMKICSLVTSVELECLQSEMSH